MTQPPTADLHFFDPDAEVDVRPGALPHWLQSGVVCFITWRTWDSLPAPWVEEWMFRRAVWLRREGIDANGEAWREQVATMPPPLRAEFHRAFSGRWEAQLDRCHGECVLRRPALSETVARSLRHFDGERYTLLDYVVMPNHVHLLATFRSIGEMLAQCTNWKKFTATEINRALGRSGRFWQTEAFDYLVRSEPRFRSYREYIALNPVRAGLKPGEYAHYSRVLPE